jgi:hypothetical protein
VVEVKKPSKFYDGGVITATPKFDSGKTLTISKPKNWTVAGVDEPMTLEVNPQGGWAKSGDNPAKMKYYLMYPIFGDVFCPKPLKGIING